jgi:hypothetical protein
VDVLLGHTPFGTGSTGVEGGQAAGLHRHYMGLRFITINDSHRLVTGQFVARTEIPMPGIMDGCRSVVVSQRVDIYTSTYVDVA